MAGRKAAGGVGLHVLGRWHEPRDVLRTGCRLPQHPHDHKSLIKTRGLWANHQGRPGPSLRRPCSPSKVRKYTMVCCTVDLQTHTWVDGFAALVIAA